MSIYSIGPVVENPKEWNKKNTIKFSYENGEFKSWGGCIGTRACEECGHLLSGTCMCIPSYTCPVCNHEHKYEPPKYTGPAKFLTPHNPYSFDFKKENKTGHLIPEELAQKFHETYERLAPSFSYKTREASAVEWKDVPENNKNLMIAVCEEILKYQLKHQLEYVRKMIGDISIEEKENE